VYDVSCDVFTTLNIYTYIYSVDSMSNYNLQVYKHNTLLIIVICDYDAIFLDVVSFRFVLKWLCRICTWKHCHSEV